MAYETIELPSEAAHAESSARFKGRQRMLIQKPQAFADMSAEASLGLAGAWCGAVSSLLLIMILVRSLS